MTLNHLSAEIINYLSPLKMAINEGHDEDDNDDDDSILA